MFFFFFQAEDGIRDKLVTGVQTCALPIFRARGDPAAAASLGRRDPWTHSLDTVPLNWFATHTLAPSKATPSGLSPTGKVPREAPSEARSLDTLLLPWFVTHTLAPSKATPTGLLPTEKVPRVAPSEARSLDTLLLPLFVTHTLVP